MSLIPVTPVQLKEFRQRIGISQSGLAHELGVSLPTILRWESGKTRMPVPFRPTLNELEASRAVDSFVEHIKGCRREKGLFATRIEISRLVFARLAAWDAAEWEARFASFLPSAEAARLSERFIEEGLAAVNDSPLALDLTIGLMKDNPSDLRTMIVTKSLSKNEHETLKTERRRNLFSKILSPRRFKELAAVGR